MSSLYTRKPSDLTAPYPKTFLYSAAHCWVTVEDLLVTVGVTTFLFDLVDREFFYLHLPLLNHEVKAGQEHGAIDALKIAMPILSPLSGVVTQINEEVRRTPTVAMNHAFGRGWLWRMEMTKPIELRKLWRLEEYLKYLALEDPHAFVASGEPNPLAD